MKLNANVPVLDGKLFDWYNGVGHAIDSDLPKGWFKRVWVDAADEGFFVLSHKTGQLKLFTATEEVVHNDGDFVAWVFTSEDRKVRIEIFCD